MSRVFSTGKDTYIQVCYIALALIKSNRAYVYKISTYIAIYVVYEHTVLDKLDIRNEWILIHISHQVQIKLCIKLCV